MPVKGRWNLAAGVLCRVWVLACLIPRSSMIARGQDSAPEAGGESVCTLSDDQQVAAPKAFEKFARMVKGEPRCNNCHGAVNPFAENTVHLGGRMKVSPVKPVDGKVVQEDCAECHDPPWIIPSANELFTNKNAVQLCRKMKEFGGAASFLRHVRTDDFSVVGFAGTRGLNDPWSNGI